MRLLKRIPLVLLAVILLAAVGFIAWAETPLGPAPEALAALQSDGQVTVTAGDFITFTPADQQPASVGFIFYPGGRVDARSYAVPLREIAAKGYLVVLVPVRLNLAFFDINAAGPVIAAHPEIQTWVIGGHSLGGVAAALFAKDHPNISGLVFWASYPADDSLKNSNIRVLSIYGTNDMAGVQAFKEKEALMPANVQYVIIDGGNHSQFGDYGLQPGDKEATISRLEQQLQVVAAVVRFLASFEK
jgi:pimeloyl-ACP methyl ester carboxylesterase